MWSVIMTSWFGSALTAGDLVVHAGHRVALLLDLGPRVVDFVRVQVLRRFVDVHTLLARLPVDVGRFLGNRLARGHDQVAELVLRLRPPVDIDFHGRILRASRRIAT